MQNILEALRQRILISDGAMGTMLQGLGMPAGVSPELWMLSHPDSILDVMTAYAHAGADILETNTFGANRVKLAEAGHGDDVNLVNATAVSLARQAAGPQRYISGVIGPSGRFPAPVGDISFEELIDVFAQQAQSLSLSGVDLILLQTFSDIGEARAAYLGVRKVTTLPVAVSLTYGQNGRTLTGTDPETAAVIFSALGADILGVNCSTGPGEMLAVVGQYRKACRLPLLAEPNAGVPRLVDGRSVFPLTPEDMAPYASGFLASGVRYLGGCCGTTPAHIREIATAAEAWDGHFLPDTDTPRSSLASRSRTVHIASHLPPRLIGERLNPTGRKNLSDAIMAGDFDVYAREGRDQVSAGADMVNVNVGLAGSDEIANLAAAVRRVQQTLDSPLMFDSVNPRALEQALIHYHGKALINSVNGKESSLSAILPLAKRYGAAVVGLALDEQGVPDKAEDRLRIAGRILDRALAEGIAKENLFIDCLVLAAAADPFSAAETLRAVTLVKRELGLPTVLGISNISHGMPKRPWLNQAFLAQALAAGLDLVIANPLNDGVRRTMAAGAFLAGRDAHGARYIEQARDEDGPSDLLREPSAAATPGPDLHPEPSATAAPGPDLHPEPPATATPGQDRLVSDTRTTDTPDIPAHDAPSTHTPATDTTVADAAGAYAEELRALQQAIVLNDRTQIRVYLKPLIAEIDFIDLINRSIIPALGAAGDSYAKGETFLPQLLVASEGASFTFDYLKVANPSAAVPALETVVLGTVAGDIHDIGKNIVKAILSSYGYHVVDLGKSVPTGEFVSAVREHHAKILGLSALMTTTMIEMEPIIRAIRHEGLDVKILLGGAVLTEAYAESIGADAFVKDASEAHGIIRRLLDGQSPD